MSNQSLDITTAYIPPTSRSLTSGKRSRPSVNTRSTLNNQLYICRHRTFHHPLAVFCSTGRVENDFEGTDHTKGPSHQLKTRHGPDTDVLGPDAKKTNDFHHSGERTGDRGGSSDSDSVSDSHTPSFRHVKYSPNFRWPFYQGGPSSDANSNEHIEKDTSSKESKSQTNKSSNHPDLSPNLKLPTRNLFPFPEHTKSIQQRWKQVVDKMLPPRSTTKEGSVSRDNGKRHKISIDMRLSETNDNQSPKSRPAENQGSSVRELYKPPPSSSDMESSRKKNPWFRSPWNRTEDGHDTSASSSQSSDDAFNLSDDNIIQENCGDAKSPPSNKPQEKPDSPKGQRWSFPLWGMSRNSQDSSASEHGKSESDSTERGRPQESNSSKSDALYSSASQTKITENEDQKDSMNTTTSSEDATKPSSHRGNSDEESSSRGPDSESQSRTSCSNTDSDIDSKAERDLEPSRPDGKRHISSTVRDSQEVTFSQRDIANIRLIFGSETFFATEAMSAPGGLIFRGNLRGDPVLTLQKLENRLKERFGNRYTICLAEGDEDRRPVVVVVPSTHYLRSLSPRQRLIAIIVAAMTATTCLSRGISANLFRQRMFSAYGLPPLKNIMDKLFFHPLSSAVTIACAIAFIVLISQITQRIVASFYRTRITLPFVLPSYQLGSFGAIVHIASPAPSRTALFDIAAAGTATLLIISLTCLLIGLRLSTTFSAVFPVPMSMVSGSILMGFLTKNVPNGKILVDYGQSLIGLHPLAIIGANCLTITALNLLPIRLLDGGRIMSALYGRKVGLVVSRMAVLFLLLASSRTPYLVMFLLAVSFGPWYVDRPSKNELTEPNGIRTIIGYLLMLTMLGILLPYPKSAFFGTLSS